MMDETTSSAINQTQDREMDVVLARVRGMPGRRRLRAWGLPTAMGSAFVIALVWLEMTGHLDTAWPALAALALICGPGIGYWIQAERRELRTIKTLVTYKQLRAVGGLLECVTCSNRRVRNEVEEALVDLLPQLTENRSDLLDTGQREALNALLYGKSGALAVAALSALEQVGDGTALPYLTSIAAGKGVPHTLRHRQSEVQACAQRTVAMIRERIERHNRASVLLRASQIPDTPSAQLVRAADSQPVVNAQELLRPEVSLEQDPGQKEKML